jgi:hypothetical protein
MSKNGFQTKVWGPVAWMFLHIVAQNFDPSKTDAIEGYISFFKNLGNVLPCGACRDNYKRLTKSGPLKLDHKVFKTRRKLCFWFFRLHNRVQNDIFNSTKLNSDKPMYNDSFKHFSKVYAFYEKFRAKCSTDKTSYGCTVPFIGIRKRVRIKICPLGKRFKAHTSIHISDKCKI